MYTWMGVDTVKEANNRHNRLAARVGARWLRHQVTHPSLPYVRELLIEGGGEITAPY